MSDNFEAHGMNDINEANASEKEFEGKKVLLCVNGAITQDIFAGMLHLYGIVPAYAENGAQALRLLDREDFDLVFIETSVPVISGHEVAVKIRLSNKGYRDIPIVAIVSGACKEEALKCLGEGMSGYIQKPLNAKAVYEELSKHLKRNSPDVGDKPSGALVIPEIDTADGLKRFAGKKAVYEKSLLRFAEHLENGVPALEKAILASNYNEAREIAHKIKGVAGNLGAKKLYKLALELENGLKEGVAEKDTAECFFETSQIIKDGIKNALESASCPVSTAQPKADGSAEAAAELLKELLQSAERFDPEASEKTVQKLKDTNWQGLDNDALSDIYNLVYGYQFQEACERIKMLLGGMGSDG